MKKLILRFEGMKDMLTKEQMKKVTGGYGSSGGGGCVLVTCVNESTSCWYSATGGYGGDLCSRVCLTAGGCASALPVSCTCDCVCYSDGRHCC